MDPIKTWTPEEQEFYYQNAWLKSTIGGEFEQWCRAYADRTAVVSGSVEITYAELFERVEKMTLWLMEKNVRRGECVLLQMPNSIGFIVLLFALLRIRAVPILALPAQRAIDVVALCGIAGPTHYISADRYFNMDYGEVIDRLKEKHPEIDIITFSSENDPDLLLTDCAGCGSFTFNEGNNLDVAILLLSGGTTGTPKLIPRTHADYSYNYRTMAGITGLDGDSVYLNILPTAHNFSLSCPGVFGILSVGGKLVIARSGSFDEGFELIAEHGVTITAMVPTLAKLWADAVEWDEPDLSSLKVLQVGGARLDPQDAVVIQKRFGCRLQQVFGTAEGLICCTRLDDSDDAVVNSQGKPISPYDNCVIVDDNDRPLPQGEIGELLVKGPYTIHEYYRAGEKNLTAFNAEGYYRMGDLVRMRDDGNFEVRGRIKEQINRAGEKIAAAEVETLLLEHPCIESCAVVPVKDEVLGERICAFAIGEEMNLSEVRDYLRAKGLALFKLPDQLVFIDSWPLTAVGKIDKKRLAAMGGEAA
ncbi:AMP-binding protein [uncultured Ruminobacter sp.]|uniref:(2,3-dihydroxybenzoyl)adenylate synthase n=1 Tax=uncultured Ruminobacter sp. TaxID=538947 RepID=UPI0025D98977|nr:AMP-binding protein [uncultured Ruminobacter sp.]